MTSCQSASSFSTIRTATLVDLEKFSGNWYVIANIPTFIEKDAYNSVESYAVDPNGKIATTFTFNNGGFDGKQKIYTPTASVRDGSGNAIWGMQFVWPFKAEYRIIYVDPNYEFTIIGRSKRDYVWLMARDASIAEADYQRLISIIQEQGYDLDNLRKVPQISNQLNQ
jgi:apolipoprotein D and lipocalin family protein